MEEMNFEEMRNQYAILKQQLKNQEIINDHLLRKTMKDRKNAINSTKILEYVCVALCILLYPLLYFDGMFSLAFLIATCLMVLFCAVATWYMHRPVDELNFMRDDLSTVARVMARFKKQYNQWLYFVAPLLIIPWGAWACYEFAWKNAHDGIYPWAMTIGLIVGALIGLAIGLYFHFKAVNAAQDIIDEIEDV
jgi:ABC-type uncharacterized transport system permease subunit